MTTTEVRKAAARRITPIIPVTTSGIVYFTDTNKMTGQGDDRPVGPMLKVFVAVQGLLRYQVGGQASDEQGPHPQAEGDDDRIGRDGKGPEDPVEGEGGIDDLKVEEQPERGSATHRRDGRAGHRAGGP